MKKISLLAIGNELLNGKVDDLNTKSLSSFTKEYNFELLHSLFCKDNADDIIKSVNYLLNISDHLIVSGGLGPTKDDITKQTLSKILGSPKEQLKNHNGTCLGEVFKFQDKYIIAVPGVPHEFSMMLEKEVFSFLKIEKKNDNQVVFKTHGMNEAKIFEELEPDLWNKLEEFGQVSCLPVIRGVNIGVNLNDPSKKVELVDFLLGTKLKSLIWQIGNKSLEEYIIHKLQELNLTISTAESCTGGLVASMLTDVAGSSSVFMGSVVSYSNEVKINSLGVLKETLDTYGAVSTEVATQMADGVRKNLATDIGISTTGIAGPGGGSEHKPVGTVCIGVSFKGKTISKRLELCGDRNLLKKKFAASVLFLLVRETFSVTLQNES